MNSRAPAEDQLTDAAAARKNLASGASDPATYPVVVIRHPGNNPLIYMAGDQGTASA